MGTSHASSLPSLLEASLLDGDSESIRVRIASLEFDIDRCDILGVEELETRVSGSPHVGVPVRLALRSGASLRNLAPYAPRPLRDPDAAITPSSYGHENGRVWAPAVLRLLADRVAGTVSADEKLRLEAGNALPHLLRKHVESLYYLRFEPHAARQRLYDKVLALQQLEAFAVMSALVDEGARPVVVKGLEVASRYNGRRSLGLRLDVDLLLSPKELWAAKKTLYARGYRQGDYDAVRGKWRHFDGAAVARAEANHYELVRFSRPVRMDLTPDEMTVAREFPSRFLFLFPDEESCLARIDFDVHHNLFAGYDLRPLLDRIVPSAVGAGFALSPADHLWFLIHRYYTEVGNGEMRTLRHFATISAMLRDPAMDWDVLVRDALSVSAAAPSFYWLRFFDDLVPGTIPSAVLLKLRQGLDRSRRNWGDQICHLFEVTPESQMRALLSADGRNSH